MTVEEPSRPLPAVADAIVVGGGTAGSIVAARLSEDPTRSVLLLELGPDYGADPANWPVEFTDSFASAPDSHSGVHACESGANGRRLPLPRAQLIGGCSAHNSCGWVRGTMDDYDAWADLGNPGWGWDEVLPVFNRIERDPDFEPPLHGKDGPIPINRIPREEMSAFADAALETSLRGGPLAGVPDFNGRHAESGLSPLPMNTRRGIRWNAALAYLTQTVRARPNLTICAHTLVDTVLLEGNRAVGVRAVDATGIAQAITSRRVVLTAGSYDTPTILLRSGIGPPDELAALGLHCCVPLPGVGRNLRDHCLIPTRFRLTDREMRTGHALIEVLARGRSRHARGTDADLQLIVQCGPIAAGATEMAGGLAAALYQTHSVGSLTLRSADPTAAPRIDHGYLTDAREEEALADALSLARELAGTPPLSTLITEEVLPGPTVRTRSEIRAFIRNNVDTIYHPVGTCKMGAESDQTAVVSARGDVHGVAGLTVADGSIMPCIPTANTHWPILMVAERVADFLLAIV